MLLSKLFAAALAGGLAMSSPLALLTRDQQVIIGYRTVSKAQADRWNNAGTPTDDGNQLSTQIGKGVYTSAKPGGWPGSSNSWYCVILANSEALDRVSKAWVPESFAGTKLWYNNDLIDEYIKEILEDSWDPAKTIRLSIIDQMTDDDLQLVIPPGLLNSNGGAMGLVAICKEKLSDLPSAVVNYDDWQNNIKGSRKDPLNG